MILTRSSGALFSKIPKSLRSPKSRSKIQNILILVLSYSHILNMNRDSLHTRSLRLIHTSLSSDTDEVKMAFRAWPFEKNGPRSQAYFGACAHFNQASAILD